jgi:hypothetical protein
MPPLVKGAYRRKAAGGGILLPDTSSRDFSDSRSVLFPPKDVDAAASFGC